MSTSISSSVMKLQHGGGANNLISFSTTVVLTVFIKLSQNNFEPRSWKSPDLSTQPSSEYFIAASQRQFEGSA